MRHYISLQNLTHINPQQAGPSILLGMKLFVGIRWTMVGIVALLSACSVTRTSIPFPIEVSKGACKGRCPVYQVVIFEGGRIQFIGEANTTKLGRSEVKISRSDFNALASAYQKIKYPAQEAFDEHRYDLPIITINDQEHTLSFKRFQSVDVTLSHFVEQLDSILEKHQLL